MRGAQKAAARILRQHIYSEVREFRREGIIEVDAVLVIKVLADDPSSPPILAWKKAASENAWINVAQIDKLFRDSVRPKTRGADGEPFAPLG